MNQTEFLKRRDELVEKKKAFDTAINNDYTKIVDDFIDEVSPIKLHQVYEPVKDVPRRRGFSRFIVYGQDIQMFDRTPMIRIGGWWLDENNVPKKWDNMTVYGIGNPAVFKLSENQDREKHPDADKDEEESVNLQIVK